MQVVTVDVGDPALEQVAESRVGVLADRDQEVGSEVARLTQRASSSAKRLSGRLSRER